MNRKIIIPAIWYLLIGSFIVSNSIQSQVLEKSNYKYISPVPNSKYIMPENNIALRHGDRIDEESLQNFGMLVSGSESGRITGKIKLSTDGKTLIFNPNKPFQFSEKIQVKTSGLVKTYKGECIQPVNFSFYITDNIPHLPKDYIWKEELKYHQSFIRNNSGNYSPRNKSINEFNLPEDYPDFSVEVLNNPSVEGYYFIAPFGYWGWFPDATPYLIIHDTTGAPVFYRKLDYEPYDFKLNENGLLSFYYNNWPDSRNYVMNKSFDIIDDYTMQNGYGSDFHEFFMLENGHAFVMDYDPQIVDMSQYVTGGVENATVIGWVFQELDIDKNVVFQWRSWDHFEILDAEGYVDLTASSIDLIHGNSIEVGLDNNLLLSPRNLNEITKIDRNSGEIIWRLEGNNNMFEFINDTLHFSWQHDARILANGNLSLFDNGSYHLDPKFSSTAVYELDEENLTATLTRRLRSDPDVFGVIMGNAQEASNGNIVTGWGSGVPGTTEFNTAGEIVAEYYFESINYRAYRFPFSTTYFELNKDTLDFGYIWHEDELTKNIEVYNNQAEDIELTSYYLHSDIFILENELPLTVPSAESISLQVTFSPSTLGNHTDVLTINSDINSDTLVQRIAQQIRLIGNATEGQGDNDIMDEGNVYLYPNPVDKELILKFSSTGMYDLINLRNIYGQSLIERTIDSKEKIVVNLEKLPSGIYFVYLKKSNNTGNQCYKIIKN